MIRRTAELARSVYLPLLRGLVPKSLEAFDPVSQTLVTGQREATTVPRQALFFLNSPFVREQALAFAKNVNDGTAEDANDEDRRTVSADTRPHGDTSGVEACHGIPQPLTPQAGSRRLPRRRCSPMRSR
ncbi:MAG: DUF1553 domain-containing protein [Luteolibacter sp.]